jgi:hypothetical protein
MLFRVLLFADRYSDVDPSAPLASSLDAGGTARFHASSSEGDNSNRLTSFTTALIPVSGTTTAAVSRLFVHPCSVGCDTTWKLRRNAAS